MAICFNEASVPAEPASAGAGRQRLLTDARVPGANIRLDRLILSAGANIRLDVPAHGLAWFQMLTGAAVLKRGRTRDDLDAAHVAFLPPGFSGSLSASTSAALIYAEIADAARFDPDFAADPPRFRIVDWTREPVLDSEHDARKRIYLATPQLFGTKAIKGEMIVYPAGTMAANHHHEGAEHFMYILRGRGTAWANEKPFPVRAGDVVWYPDRERHYLKADDDAEMAFAEFFVPGEFRTVWVNPDEVCAWLPTGRDISGNKPAREIAAHSSAEFFSPQDV